MDSTESRRLRCYRELRRVNNVEDTLRFRAVWSRGQAVTCATSNNPVGANYWNGRADGIEDLIEMIKKSKSTRKPRGRRDQDEDNEEIV